MANGYAGQILRINLTTKETSIIATSDYEQWLGGAGIGAAIFWDLCTDKTADAFAPENVITMLTGPLCGTGAPSCPQMIMQGVGPYTYPKTWYTRSVAGGHFGTMLKYAGYDGIVLEGKADTPSWISIINDVVTINDASEAGDNLWGTNAFSAQEKIYALMTQNHNYPNWLSVDAEGSSTVQRPSVLAIAQSGENLGRNAAITCNGSGSFSQGGFGGVWGSKNLKAIGVIGTGSIEVADPVGVVQARINAKKVWCYNVDEPVDGARVPMPGNEDPGWVKYYSPSHLVGCPGCWSPCRKHSANGGLNETTCGASHWYITATEDDVIYRAQDLCDIYAINTNDMSFDDTFKYLLHLYNRGVLGPGKEIDSGDFPWEEIIAGTYAGALAYTEAIAHRKGIGNDIAEGMTRAAIRWGRYEEDTTTGLLPEVMYGIINHHTFSTIQWADAELMGDRDLNETSVESFPTYIESQSIDEVLTRWTEKMGTGWDDIFMFDSTWQGVDGSSMEQARETGIYSESKAKLIAWERYFCYGWMHSLGIFCKSSYGGGFWFGGTAPEYEGFTPNLELQFAKAILGRDITFDDVLELGRKVFLLFRSIYAAQGRLRDDEVFSNWVYTPGDPELDAYEDPGVGGPKFSPAAREGQSTERLNRPCFDGSTWHLENNAAMYIDRDAHEEWKTKFYKLTGLSEITGQPTRVALEAAGLSKVADDLEAMGKLGS
jgi:aldehyde:ferredoxin oxidoreductase